MTITETKDWKVFITPIVWHEVEDKVPYLILEKLLNPNINPKLYGQGINEIICKMIVVKNDKIHRPFLEYDQEKQVVYIGVKLPYKIVEQSNELKIIELMKQAFLKGILTIKTVTEIEGFDINKLYQDTKKVLYPIVEIEQ